MRYSVIALTLLFSQLSFAGEAYPKRLQEGVSDTLYKSATARLQSAVKKYNDSLANPSTFEDIVQKLSISDTGKKEILAYSNTLSLPQAMFSEERIRIEAGAWAIEMNAADYLTGTIHVNGKPFRWNPNLSVTENIHRYDQLFQTAQKKSDNWIPFVTEAQADDYGNIVFRVKAGGFRLLFIIDSIGTENEGQEFVHLDEKVLDWIQKCQADLPNPNGYSVLAKIFHAIDQVDRSSMQEIRLKSCKDIKDLSQKGFIVGHENSTFHLIPPDLCKHLDQLTECIKSLGGNSSSVAKDKKKQVADPDEWTPSKNENTTQPAK